MSNAISCGGCRNKEKADPNNPKLTLSTNKSEYQGEKDLQIELLIAHKNSDTKQPIPYDNLSLEIAVNQENGTEKSIIEYETFDSSGTGTKKQITSVIEKLTALFKTAGTDSIEPTKQLRKSFTLLPKGNPTKITITYKLLDTTNSNEVIEQCTTTWKPEATSNYELTIEGGDTSIQAPSPINLKINKKEGPIEKNELDNLILEVIRESGDAKFDQAPAGYKLELKFLENDLAQDGSIKKTLTVTLGTSPETKFKLSLNHNTHPSTSITVTYSNAPTGTWQFEVVGANPATHIKTIEDGTTDTEIKVYKAGNAVLTEEELKGLKLYLKRITPGTAKIANLEDGILELTGTDKLTLATDNKSATKKLTINPISDKNTTFALQLQDKTGANVGIAQRIVWEKSNQLELKAQYNINNKEVTIIIKNSGKLILPAKQAKLTWDTGYNTVTIDGKQQDHEDIGELKPKEDFVFLLRNVHFADPIHTPTATLKLELTWQQLEGPIQTSCPLTAIPIDITITKLAFNKSTNQIIYAIKNNSSEDSALQVKCINTKPTNENAASITTPLPAYINLMKAGNPGSDSGEKTLQVDFKNESSVDFKFELLLGGHPINFKYNATDGSGEKEMNQTIVTCKPTEVSLKFTDTKGSNFPVAGLNLQGDNKGIEFKIGLNGNPADLVTLDQIDKTKLKLLFTTTSGDAKIKQGTNIVAEIQGNNLNLAGENKFFIERGTDNQASFNLHLMYDIQGNGKFTKELAKLPISWKEDKFEILIMNPTENNALIEKDPAIFVLQNTTGNTEPARIEIELKNQDGVPSQFLTKQDSNFDPTGYSSGSLEKILGINTPVNTQTIIRPIYFGVVNTKIKDNTEINIVVKKDGHEVARTTQPIKWQAKKVDVKIANILNGGKAIIDNLLIDEGSDKDVAQAFTIILQNEGDNINTNDVEVNLTNENNVQFTLGKETGDHIDADLLHILGRSRSTNTTFSKATTKAFTLQLHDNNNPPFTKITLTISSPDSSVLATKELLWVNLSAITRLVQTAKNLKTRLDEIAGNATPYSFEKILENITDDSDIKTDKKTLISLLTGPILYGSMDMNKNHIENSGMKEILKGIKNILEQLQKINQGAKAANDNQDIVSIKQAIDDIEHIYNGGQRILERKVTKFAQQILFVGQKHLSQAMIESQANGEMAALKYYQVFNPLEKVMNALVKSTPTPSSPAKAANHPLNRIFKQISNIIAQTQEEVAKKYEQDKNAKKAEEFRKMAETWTQSAKAYTGV